KGFAKFLLAFVIPFCNQDLPLYFNESFDLIKGGLKRMAIKGISKAMLGLPESEYNKFEWIFLERFYRLLL
ncbi:MAG: hypothetical protein VW418_07535, partial [Gammaproteobacteria bacterium]